MKQPFLALFLFILLSSCSSLKLMKVLKSGNVPQQNYFETIPFQLRAGIPIVEAKINGVNGFFLFDTGAPNVISKEFSELLNLEVVTTGNVSDSGGNVIAKQSFVNLDKVEIGNVDFVDTGAIIQDFNASDVMRCLDIDGIIGANLMRKSYVKINNQNQTISITDRIENFKITDTYVSIDFNQNVSGTPLINLELNDTKFSNVEFDTGSNGHISLPNHILNSLETQKPLNKLSAFGSSTHGVGGKSKNDTIQYAVINNIDLGKFSFNNQIVKFSQHGNTIGYEFFKNFDMVLDWVNNKIYLLENKTYNYSSITHFGFSVDVRQNGIYVGSILENSEAENQLIIGDQILKINDNNFETISYNEVCNNIINNKWEYNDNNQLTISIHRDGKTHTFNLEKMKLL